MHECLTALTSRPSPHEGRGCGIPRSGGSLEGLEELLIEKQAKLLIVDSIASLVRKEFDSRSTVDRTDLLQREASLLK